MLTELPDARPVLATVRHQVVDGYAIDARRPTVPHDARVRGDQVLSPHHLLDERQSLVSARVFACRARLTRCSNLLPFRGGLSESVRASQPSCLRLPRASNALERLAPRVWPFTTVRRR